jgi:hypothetical protein
VSVVDHVAMIARADAHGAVVEAFLDENIGLPVSLAVVQVAVWAVEGRELPVDLPEGNRVRCVGADDLRNCAQRCRVSELAGRAEEVVDDDGIAVISLAAERRSHVDAGSRPGDLHDAGHFTACPATEACGGCLPDPFAKPGDSCYGHTRSSLPWPPVQ